VANNNQIYKMSNAGGFKSLVRYYDMLAGNTTWNPWSPTGAYDALATTTVGSGGAASVTFSGIPSTYKHLQIRSLARDNSASGTVTYFKVNFNSDSGSNYTYHRLGGDGSSAFSDSGSSITTTYANFALANSSTTQIMGASIIDVLDYANVAKYKTIRTLAGADQNGSGRVGLSSGLWMSTSAVTSITLVADSGTFGQYSQFALYGVK